MNLDSKTMCNDVKLSSVCVCVAPNWVVVVC